MSGDSTSKSVLGASTAAAAGSFFTTNLLFKGIILAAILAALIILGIRLYKIYLAKKQSAKQ
ncbi:MAG: hypothetical protein WC080_04640 [Patescibacteria group bacterium]|jgi:tellurite resistance protein TehA-like permease